MCDISLINYLVFLIVENEITYIDLRRKIEIKKMSNLVRNEII
jgi:hypothetical protein